MTWVFQGLSIMLCLGLALLMIINNQMSGEAMWFWYATAFHHGAKLYSQLHTALQPLFVLEVNAWMRISGLKLVNYEIPSIFHALLLAIGIFLVLRESEWPDWQKAIVLLGAFALTVGGHSYRFDDYHVIAETLVLYVVYLLLRLGRPTRALNEKRDLRNVALLGVTCGLCQSVRITDGTALAVGAACCLLIVLRHKRLAAFALFWVATFCTLFFVVKLTGDSLSAWSANSIFRAAGSKGGTGSILTAPLVMIGNTVPPLITQKKFPILIGLFLLTAFGIKRYLPALARLIVPLQLVLAGLMFLTASPVNRLDLKRGLLFEDLVLYSTLGMYCFAVAVAVRYIRRVKTWSEWDRREVLLMIPILQWASYAAASAGQPILNYYAPVAVLLLLIPVLQPFRREATWLNPTVVTIMALVAVNGLVTKWVMPYDWQNYRFPAMFTKRQVFHHPVYGLMYVDRNLLRFSEKVCNDIGEVPSKTQPELLSLPYPFPNYFCSTPPWHNYVQTFFDTATRSTIEQLMRELSANPPEWIVYQRQINIINGAERLYNHGQPIAQRDLDAVIAHKLDSGEWTLVDHSDYLRPEDPEAALGTGWYVIHTRQANVQSTVATSSPSAQPRSTCWSAWWVGP